MKKGKKVGLVLLLILVVGGASVASWFAHPEEWSQTQRIVVYLPAAVALVFVVTWFFTRNILRTRYRMNKQLEEDKDINDWIVIFGWSQKVLYMPTVITALIAGFLIWFMDLGWIPDFRLAVGGVWVIIAIFNFFVEEFEFNLKLITLVVCLLIAVMSYLLMMGWVDNSWGAFQWIFSINLNAQAYFLLASIFMFAIGISWIKGLFYYYAFTPGYLNIQKGPTEAGGHVDKLTYETDVDTGDALERLFGFGRVIITFKDDRPPISLLVWNIGKVAQMLEIIRSKTAIDRPKVVLDQKDFAQLVLKQEGQEDKPGGDE